MGIVTILLIILGLALFETISSIDNAIINAEVLHTMGENGQKWFLTWGLFLAVFLVRGLLPFLIVWLVNPSLGPIGALTAAFSSDPKVSYALEQSAPMLLVGGGVFLLFLFFHWLFLEPKHFGLKGERFIYSQGVWFFAATSFLLSILVFIALQFEPRLALGAVIGSTVFFISHGFKHTAESAEEDLMKGVSSTKSDLNKILYLEAIDATFSIDGVLGAFAFTLSVPLILVGNGIGALVVRKITVGNISRIHKLKYLKNGAMYSIFFLGVIMLLTSFGLSIPEWLSPILTFLIVGYFFIRSRTENS